jgi:hypothetical protein
MHGVATGAVGDAAEMESKGRAPKTESKNY